jgi:hypothetical protein
MGMGEWRMIVYESNTDNLRIEWNESATFNVYFGRQNVECFTHYGAEGNARLATRYAREWIIDNRWNGSL